MKKPFTRLVALLVVLLLALSSLPMVLMADDTYDPGTGDDGTYTDDTYDGGDDNNYVVMINDETGYGMLQDALEAAVDGDTLTMLQDIFLAGPVPVNVPWGTITLNLSGCTIRLYDAAENAMGEGGDADVGSGGMFVLEAGTLVVVDEIFGAPQRGSLQSTNQSWPIFWLEGDYGDASLQIEGGAYRTTDAGTIGIDENYADSTVWISGGNFDKQQPQEYLASGYGQVLQDDGTYEIVQVPTFTITWQNWDGTALEYDDVNEGDTPQYYGDTPTRPEDDSYTYEFIGWDQDIVPAADNAVYTAVYNAIPKPTPVPTYTITWQNWDGTALETDTVNQGDTPQYNGATPTRPDDDSNTYAFAGWDQQIVPAAADAVYTAVFSATPKPTPVPTDTIIWQNWDGSQLETDTVTQGETPLYAGVQPVRPEDANYTYQFAGWNPAVNPAAGDMIYTATYNAVPKPTQPSMYTITWKNWDGTVLQSGQAQQGTMPAYSGSTPVKPADSQYTYTFAGWQPQVAAVTADATYTAVFNSQPVTPSPDQDYEIRQENLPGLWSEDPSGRAKFQIIPGSYESAVNGGEEPDLYARVLWSSSASEETEYKLCLYRIEGENAYSYKNGVISHCTYDANGNEQKQLLTDSSTGQISISLDEKGVEVISWEDSYDQNCSTLALKQVTMGEPGSDRPLYGPIDYSDGYYWVSLPYNDATEYTYDVFMVEPTVNMKDDSVGNENILDAKIANRFRYTFNVEKGILGESARIFSPLYRQKTMGCYLETTPDGNEVINLFNTEDKTPEETETAYQDVKDAFVYYLENENNDNPFVLFGYSQGAEMLLKLLEEMGDDERIENQMVAAYLIGWTVTEDDLAQYPHLKMAQAADDTGVIVCFDCVDERAEKPEVHSVSINPFNWKTDDTKADKSENPGFVGVDTDGVVNKVIPQFCGAYLDPESGAVILTDMDEANDLWSEEAMLFPQGYYHQQDLNIAYWCVENNITDRVAAFNK